VSESLRQTRDEEVQEIAEEAYRGAHRLLSDHRDLLDDIAERLLANEVIERDEIQAIMDAYRDSRDEPLPGMEQHAPEPISQAAEALGVRPPEAPRTSD